MSEELTDLKSRGARVVNVFGAFHDKCLVALPIELARELFEPFDLLESSRTGVIEAVERDLEGLRARDPGLAESALAAAMIALAYEVENPYNSATSKSMCVKELREATNRLRELAPPARERDNLDELNERRRLRLAQGGAGT